MPTKYLMENYPIGNKLVPYGTALHSTELFLRLLKVIFSATPADYPYHYDDTNFDDSGIAFDVSLNKESEIFGKKPLIIVSRGTITTTPMDIGDLATSHIPTGFKKGSNIYTSQLNFQVLSKTKAEVEVLGQIIFDILMFRRTHLPKLLNIHMVQSIMLSEVTKLEDDDTIFTSQGSISYLGQYIWTQMSDHPVLSSIGLSVDPLNG